MKRQEYLSKHPYKIGQGKDGYWHTHVKDSMKKCGRRTIRKKTREELIDALCEFYEHPVGEPTVQDIFYDWDNRRLDMGKIKPGTFARDEQVFNKHLKGISRRKISEITEGELEDLLEEQVMIHHLTAKSFNSLKCVMRGIFRRARRKGVTRIDIVSLINNLDMTEICFRKVVKEDYEEVFSEEETKKILPYLKENADMLNLAIAFLFYTGLRVGELVALKPEDFDGFTVKIRRQESRDRISKRYVIVDAPKTLAGNRTVVIPRSGQWVLKRMRLLNPFGEFAFMIKGNRMQAQQIRRRLKAVCLELDIYPKSPHKIRKTYGSILLDNNLDKNFVKQQMGHTDILVTEQHYHRNRKSLEEKEEILSSIADFI